MKEGSVGIVKTRYFDFAELQLDCGEKLAPVRLAYEAYGRLNKARDNTILIFHALSGDAHAAGQHRSNSKKKGWYDIAVGPGKPFDTRKYFVVCANVIGGCKGSTGPSSINPKTRRLYGLDFPVITIRDMVRAQKNLVDHLGIRKLFCVTGGSMGGMQALEWVKSYPDSAELAIVIATAAMQPAVDFVYNEIGRRAIQNDPAWNNGGYYGGRPPKEGLSLARQVGHVTYVSNDALERKFGRKKVKRKPRGKFGVEFELQNYFKYKGGHFVKRFDANSYLYITRAIDQFDLTEGGNLTICETLKGVSAKILLVSFTSDLLYPPKQVEEIYADFAQAGVRVEYEKLDLPYGHDSFLIYNNTLGNVLVNFLEKERQAIEKRSDKHGIGL